MLNSSRNWQDWNGCCNLHGAKSDEGQPAVGSVRPCAAIEGAAGPKCAVNGPVPLHLLSVASVGSRQTPQLVMRVSFRYAQNKAERRKIQLNVEAADRLIQAIQRRLFPKDP